MKRITLFITLFCCTLPLMGMDVACRQATPADVDGIVQLLQNASADKDKIVIVPKLFRHSKTEEAVSKGRLFVAACTQPDGSQKIVGFKKLFCITQPDEIKETVEDELCCPQPPAHTTFIYNGADYTHPDYRNKGINAQLTAHALNSVTPEVIEHMHHNQSRALALAYGLTHANAGISPRDGRTKGIIKQFMPCAHAVAARLHCAAPAEPEVERYPAYMPTFDADAAQCIPLSPEHSVAGYGNLLVCALKQVEQ